MKERTFRSWGDFMRNIILLTVLAIVFVAGCAGQPPGGGDIIASADVITATNEPVIPAEPAAGTTFTARFTVSNQDKIEKARNVGVWIYDTGKCELQKIGGYDAGLLRQGSYYPGIAINTGLATPKTVTDFVPGQEELVRLDMKAPESNEIGGLSYTCPIRYMVNYTFTAKSSMTVDVMTYDRLKQIETQTGERPAYTRTLNVGAGPIRIFMESVSSLPVESGKTFKFTMTLKNEGTGDYTRIAPDTLQLTMPEDFFEPVTDSPETSTFCGGYFKIGDNGYTNAREITLIQKEASPITCEFITPTSVQIEREYTINAQLPDYSYGYFGQQIDVPVSVTP
jgi:hypothetical protein